MHPARNLSATFLLLLILLLQFVGPSVQAAEEDVPWRMMRSSDLPDEVRRWIVAKQHQKGVSLLPAGKARYLLISWGNRPTGGYEMHVSSVERLPDWGLRVTVRLTKPNANEFVTQVITNPHLVLELPKEPVPVLVEFQGAPWFDHWGPQTEEDESIMLDVKTQPDGSLPNPAVVRGKIRTEQHAMRLTLAQGDRPLFDQVVSFKEETSAGLEFEVVFPYLQPEDEMGTITAEVSDASLRKSVGVKFSQSSSRLPDVDGHWAEVYIRQGVWSRYIDGYPDGFFYPDRYVSRAEFLKMLVTARTAEVLSRPSAADWEPPFADMRRHWAAAFLEQALRNGWILGEEEGEAFRPDDPITREEMARWISRYAALDEHTEYVAPFADMESIATEFRGWVNAALEAGLLKGYEDNTFRPQHFLSRAEAAAVLGRLTT